MKHDPKTMCPEQLDRRYCTKLIGHDGQCGYKNEGGQGGNWVHWWGVNPRPVEWVGDLSQYGLVTEIYRLRKLCDEAGIDWRTDVTKPGH